MEAYKKGDIVMIYTNPVNNLYEIGEALLLEGIITGTTIELWKIIYIDTGRIYDVCIKSKQQK